MLMEWIHSLMLGAGLSGDEGETGCEYMSTLHLVRARAVIMVRYLGTFSKAGVRLQQRASVIDT